MSIEKEYHDLDRRELTVLGRWFWGTVVAVAAFFFWAAGAYAEEIPVYVIDQPQVKLKLMPSECSDPVSLGLANTGPPQFLSRWKSIQSVWQEKDGSWKEYAGCWLELKAEEVGAPDDLFVFTFSDGASGQALKSVVLNKRPGA